MELLHAISLALEVGEYWKLVFAVAVSGAVLIVVNAISHYIKERLTAKHNKAEQLEQSLKPLLRGIQSLIKRTVDVCIYEKSGERSAQSGAQIAFYRLAYVLLLTRVFGKQTSTISSYALLDEIEFFVLEKIPFALRGGAFGYRVLSSEVQEKIVNIMQQHLASSNTFDLSIGDFYNWLSDHPADAEFVTSSTTFYDVGKGLQGADMDIADQSWKRMLCVAHVGIYLIDVFQSYASTPEWEEIRLYFVHLIREWNALNRRIAVYLYEPGDLTGSSYVDTFPDVVIRSAGLRRLVWRSPKLRRWVKQRALRRRGKIYKRRHDEKSIDAKGVTVRKGASVIAALSWNDPRRTVHIQLMAYLQSKRPS